MPFNWLDAVTRTKSFVNNPRQPVKSVYGATPNFQKNSGVLPGQQPQLPAPQKLQPVDIRGFLATLPTIFTIRG